MEITNFIEREQVEKLREKIDEFMDVLEYEISVHCETSIITCINTLKAVDTELYYKLKRFNHEINDRVSKR